VQMLSVCVVVWRCCRADVGFGSSRYRCDVHMLQMDCVCSKVQILVEGCKNKMRKAGTEVKWRPGSRVDRACLTVSLHLHKWVRSSSCCEAACDCVHGTDICTSSL